MRKIKHNLLGEVGISMAAKPHYYLYQVLLFNCTKGCSSLTLTFSQTKRQSLVCLIPVALKDPCTEVTCSYGSTCVQSTNGLSAKCMCPLGCVGKAEQTVCGSDGEDYRNECELLQHACKSQKNIRVQYQGRCGELYPQCF